MKRCGSVGIFGLFVCFFISHAATLDSVTYTGGYGVRDDAGNPHVGPHWTPSSSWPHLYVRNSTFRVSVYVTVPPTQDWYLIQFRGLAPDGIVLESGSIWIDRNPSPFSFMFYADSGVTALPDYVVKYDPFSIAWQYRTRPDDCFPWSAYTPFGTSTNVLYLSLAAPAASPLYRTVVDNACKNGGATDEETAVDYVWLAFSGRYTRTWDGQKLHYYESGTTFPQNNIDLAGLLSTRRGQCYAWKQFFYECLRVHAVATSRLMRVQVSPWHQNGDYGLLVRHWSALNEGTLPPPYIYAINWPSGIVGEMWPPTVGDFGDLWSHAGVWGQGLHVPSEKMFFCHWIQKHWTGSYTNYYDPSYGRRHYTANGMEASSIYGFCSVTWLAARPSGGSGGLRFVESEESEE